MNKLTAEKCRSLLNELRRSESLSLKEEIYMGALEKALPILEQNEAPTDTYRQIENDGWIEWGGDCGPYHKPVDGSVEVKFKGGGKNRGSASIWSWKHNDCDSDIIAYRVIENDGREG